MALKTLLSLFLLFPCVSARTSFSSSSSVALKLRGGAGPLDPTLALKANAVLQVAQAAPLWLSPSTGIKLYKSKDSPMNRLLMKEVMASLLTYGVLFYTKVFHGASTSEAAALASLVACANGLQSLLDGTPESVGSSNTGAWAGVTLGAIVPFGVLTGASWVNNAVRYLGIASILSGMFLALMTEQAQKAWGGPSPDLTAKFFLKGLGWFNTGTGVAFYLLAKGESTMKAMGLSMITHLIYVFGALVITKEIDALGYDRAPFVSWLVEHVCVILTLFDQ